MCPLGYKNRRTGPFCSPWATKVLPLRGLTPAPPERPLPGWSAGSPTAVTAAARACCQLLKFLRGSTRMKHGEVALYGPGRQRRNPEEHGQATAGLHQAHWFQAAERRQHGSTALGFELEHVTGGNSTCASAGCSSCDSVCDVVEERTTKAVEGTARRLYDAIEQVLLQYRLSHLDDGHGGGYPLVDHRLPNRRDCFAPGLGAQRFPLTTTFNASMSSMASAILAPQFRELTCLPLQC